MVPGSIPCGVTGDFFRGSFRQNHVPWGRLSLWKWVPGISPGVKAAGAYGWRRTTLVVLNVKIIQSLNLQGHLGLSRDTFTLCHMHELFPGCMLQAVFTSFTHKWSLIQHILLEYIELIFWQYSLLLTPSLLYSVHAGNCDVFYIKVPTAHNCITFLLYFLCILWNMVRLQELWKLAESGSQCVKLWRIEWHNMHVLFMWGGLWKSV